jgi:hypothetical protein
MVEMSAEVSRLVWLKSLEIHLRAARAHELAATCFARLGDRTSVAQAESAWERAGAERRTVARLLARHPEWEQDASELGEAGVLMPVG